MQQYRVRTSCKQSRVESSGLGRPRRLALALNGAQFAERALNEATPEEKKKEGALVISGLQMWFGAEVKCACVCVCVQSRSQSRGYLFKDSRSHAVRRALRLKSRGIHVCARTRV